MMKKDKTYLFESKPVPAAVAELAIPTVISTLIMMLYNLADTYFVGMLNDPIQNAAVTIAAPMMLIFNAVTNLFGVGSSSVMSRALGRKDSDSVSRASCFSIYCSLLGALLISTIYVCLRTPILTLLGADTSTEAATVDYMRWTVAYGAVPSILHVVISYMIRSEGYAALASIGMMSGCLLNIILDPFMILPQFMGMGAAGAGLATFISNCVSCLYFFIVLFVRRKSSYIKLSPKYIKVSSALMTDIFGVGIPASIQNLLNVTGMTILNNFTAGFGADAVAAMGIAHKVNMIPLYLCMGTSQGVMPLISYNYTSGNHARLKECSDFVERLTIALAALSCVIVFIFSEQIMRMFIENGNVVFYGSTFLKEMSIGIPFLAVDFFAVAVFQALGKGRYSLFFAISRKIILEIPAIFILNFFFPLYGLAFSQTTAEIILAIAALIILNRIYKKLNIN